MDANLAMLDQHHAEQPECDQCDDENCTCAEDDEGERGDYLLRLRGDE